MRWGRVGAVLLAGLLAACGGDDESRPAAPTSTLTPSPNPSATATGTPTPTATVVTESGDPLSGGATTVFDVTGNAFGHPARNLPLDQRTDFFVGNALFNRSWVTAPSSTTGSDGLGPVFNARSCSSCHFHHGTGHH